MESPSSSSAMKLHPSSSSLRAFSNSFLSSPLPSSSSFSGSVPFSWEHLPGIPKKQSSSTCKKNKETCSSVLPLPPSTSHHQTRNKKPSSNSKQFPTKDPFVAALVECSKQEDDEEEDQWTTTTSAKVSRRSVSDKFGFVSFYSSACKRSCAVSHSIVHVSRPPPISRSSSSSSYDLVSHPSCSE